MKAILFGSIGTLIETSDLQREAFNQAFKEAGLDWYWDQEDYTKLLKKSGGTKRIEDFAEKNNLPFSLLSDEGGVVSKAYDSLSNFISFKASKRNTFIIDPEGNIAKIYLSVKPSTHSQMVLNDLNQLQN